MRNIFLVRHALPQFPDKDKYCIGQTDFPLSELGKIQCILLTHWAKDIFEGKTVFCSKLTRAKETAAYLCTSPVVMEGLEEMHAGLWDGLSFTEIEKRWPDIFAKRDGDKNIPIPGSEDILDGLSRFTAAVERCLDSAYGDIVIVAHSTVIQAFLAHSASSPVDESRFYKLPYCSVSKLSFDGRFHLEYYGKTQIPQLSPQLYSQLLEHTRGNVAALINMLHELNYDTLTDSFLNLCEKSGQV